MKLFSWQKGRQGSGYEIFPFIFSKFLKMDAYLIRYPVGGGIPEHRDEVKQNEKHFRLNIELWPAKSGGELNCEHSIVRFGPMNFFRPDLTLHSVSPVTKGVRYVLSIGWIRNNNK